MLLEPLKNHNPNIISPIDQANSFGDSTFHYNNSNFTFTSYTSTESPKESFIFSVLHRCTFTANHLLIIV